MSSPSACYSNHSSVRLHPPESDISIAQPQVRKKLHGNSVVGARFIAPRGWRGVNVRMSLPPPRGRDKSGPYKHSVEEFYAHPTVFDSCYFPLKKCYP